VRLLTAGNPSTYISFEILLLVETYKCSISYVSFLVILGVDREWPIEKMKDIKVKDALKHPIWTLGRKITVDSATLFNKVTLFMLQSMIFFPMHANII
jgi:hypothetical protein